MKIRCLGYEVLSVNEQGNGDINANMLLEDAGIIAMVRITDMPDRTVRATLPESVVFATPYHAEAFTAMAVFAFRMFKQDGEPRLVEPQTIHKAINAVGSLLVN